MGFILDFTRPVEIFLSHGEGREGKEGMGRKEGAGRERKEKERKGVNSST